MNDAATVQPTPSAATAPRAPTAKDRLEERMLDQLLALYWPAARAGDDAAADRVLKILGLKRAYRAEARAAGEEDWRL